MIFDSKSSSLFLDRISQDYSDVALGFLIRAMGYGLRVAYINTSNNTSKLTNFFENLCLSHSFVGKFRKVSVDIYTLGKKGIINKSHLPMVEFSTLTSNMLFNSLQNYDLVIFDQYNSEILPQVKIKAFLSQREKGSTILIVKSKKDFQSFSSQTSEKVEIEHKQDGKTVFSQKNILSLHGKGNGLSKCAFGYAIRSYINKSDVKFIYFDKGDLINYEMVFFEALKKWSRENKMYGTFDYVQTGIKRYISQSFREEDTQADKKEAQEALMLLKTSLKKQTPVIADELSSLVARGLLGKKEVLDVLDSVENELVITGRTTVKELLTISTKNYEFKEL